MKESISRNDIVKFLLANEAFLSQDTAIQISDKLLSCNDMLKPNITEWLESKPFSDIWVRDKYCLNAVLKIRGNPTSHLAVADAILALNAFAEDVSNEHLIWQKRM